MNRRQFLAGGTAASLAAIAGCSTVFGSSGGPPDDARREVSIGSVDGIPSDASFEFSIEPSNRWITDSSTATLEAEITNTGSRTRQFAPPFRGQSSALESGPGILVYNLQETDSPPEDYNPPCFGDAPQQQYVATDDGEVLWDLRLRLGPELDPGKSHDETLLVVDDPTSDGCFPPGTYEFGTSQPRYEDPAVDENQGVVEFTWTLEIERFEE